jgi:transcriptional regulator with XRE-family HTH domain
VDLKKTFIANLKKFRNHRGISQMKLAELCNTATNYIGEIEIGRRFPSLKLIEKIAQVLETEPYRFFIRGEGLIPRGSATVIKVLNPRPIPYENNIPRGSAARLLIDNSEKKLSELDETIDFLTRLPDDVRLNIINRISKKY